METGVPTITSRRFQFLLGRLETMTGKGHKGNGREVSIPLR